MFNFDKLFNSDIEDNEDLFNTLYENENNVNLNNDDATFIDSVKLASCTPFCPTDSNSFFGLCSTEEEAKNYCSSVIGTIYACKTSEAGVYNKYEIVGCNAESITTFSNPNYGSGYFVGLYASPK